MVRTPALMVQGTGSHVGKSLLVAGNEVYVFANMRVREVEPDLRLRGDIDVAQRRVAMAAGLEKIAA